MLKVKLTKKHSKVNILQKTQKNTKKIVISKSQTKKNFTCFIKLSKLKNTWFTYVNA